MRGEQFKTIVILFQSQYSNSARMDLLLETTVKLAKIHEAFFPQKIEIGSTGLCPLREGKCMK